MFFKSKSSEKEICHVCGVSLSKLKKQQKKLDKKPKASMFNAGGIMIGAQIGAGDIYHCKKCGSYTCTDCRKQIDRGNYRTDSVCPNCGETLSRDALVER